MKILVVADLKSKFGIVESMRKKVDLILCVGNTITDCVPDFEISKTCPIYFLQNDEIGNAFNFKYASGTDVLPNFRFLGKLGVHKYKNIKIGYFNDDKSFTRQEEK